MFIWNEIMYVRSSVKFFFFSFVYFITFCLQPAASQALTSKVSSVIYPNFSKPTRDTYTHIDTEGVWTRKRHDKSYASRIFCYIGAACLHISEWAMRLPPYVRVFVMKMYHHLYILFQGSNISCVVVVVL